MKKERDSEKSAVLQAVSFPLSPARPIDLVAAALTRPVAQEQQGKVSGEGERQAN